MTFGVMSPTAANDHMVMLESSSERVKSCFQDPRVKYAAQYYLFAQVNR